MYFKQLVQVYLGPCRERRGCPHRIVPICIFLYIQIVHEQNYNLQYANNIDHIRLQRAILDGVLSQFTKTRIAVGQRKIQTDNTTQFNPQLIMTLCTSAQSFCICYLLNVCSLPFFFTFVRSIGIARIALFTFRTTDPYPLFQVNYL